VMSKAQSGLGVIACISAPTGGLLAHHWGWQGALLALAVFGIATLSLITWRFQETLPTPKTNALQPRQLLAAWSQILRHPTFLAFTALSVSAYGGLFTFLVASSFVFIQVLDWTSTEYGWVLFSLSLAYLLGTFICRWLLRLYGLHQAIRVASLLSLSAGSIMSLLMLLDVVSGWSVLLPFYAFIVAHGIHQPCSQTSAIGPFPQRAGTASALNGFLMMLVAFLTSLLLGPLLVSVKGLAYGIGFWGVCIALSAWILVPRYAHT
jgi:MFS transporter, DHA1 family, multidrug resistance protein